MSNTDGFLLLKESPIYINHSIKYLSSPKAKKKEYNINMININITNAIGEDQTTSMYTLVNHNNTIEFIQKYRCNSVLDLNKRIIPIELWLSIQNLIISDIIVPPINSIYLRNSNITEQNIDPALRTIVNL